MFLQQRKVMAVASIGGHWVQLLRIARPLEQQYEIVYCSTHEKCATMVPDHEFHLITDFSRWNAWKLMPSFIHIIGILRKVKPSAVITTGAAPGLTCLMAAKMCGIKTVWVDSVANVEHLSASGRIARKFASRVYTQWPDLAVNGIVSAGNIFG